MTAAASRSGARSSTPRIPYFWWLRTAESTRRRTAAEQVDEVEYIAFEADYIPTSTADLWRQGRTRSA